MLRVPSSTTAASGYSDGITRTPNGMSPAGTRDERGGRKVIVTVPAVPGYSDSIGGSMLTHSAGTPTTSNRYASTMSIVLRTVIGTCASPPGRTVTELGARRADALMAVDNKRPKPNSATCRVGTVTGGFVARLVPVKCTRSAYRHTVTACAGAGARRQTVGPAWGSRRVSDM